MADFGEKKSTDFRKKVTLKQTILLLFVLALLATGAYSMSGGRLRWEAAVTETTAPQFEEEQTRASAEEHADNGIRIPGYSVILISAGDRNATVDFYNPEENEVYFKVRLTLSDTGEEIYESKLIKPGQHLYEIELNRELEAGDYKLLIEYETLSMDGDYSEKNGAKLNCILRAA